MLALLRNTRFPSLRILKVEISRLSPSFRAGRVCGLVSSTQASPLPPLPADLLIRLHRVRLVFRQLDRVEGLARFCSVFQVTGLPDVVEIDTGGAEITG
jgi:hypothetical protein